MLPSLRHLAIKWLVDMRTESSLNHIGDLVLMEYLLCSKRELVHIQAILCKPYPPIRMVYNGVGPVPEG
jgi:hypothetical protein